MHESTYSDARADLANLHEHALRHLPTRITRRRTDATVLLSEADFRALLRRYTFRPEVFFEASAVSIWLPELAVWVRGGSFAKARADLFDELDQLLGVLETDERARLAPNMVERLPWIYRLMGAGSDQELEELLFAEPVAEESAPSLVGA
jgi:Antitoxin of toxin-antitoxin, RelE / RelB, TA system